MSDKVTSSQIDFEKMLTGHIIGELPEEFTKPVTYILQRNGVWEVRKTEIGLFTRHLVEHNIPGLPNVVDENLDELFVPRIPISILGQAVSFFRHIYDEMKSESFIDIIYNQNEDKYYTYCPKQKVSGSSVAWEIPEDEEIPQGIKVLELHSHCDMGSFFSGIDDADEKADQYYGVIGKLANFMPKMSFRLVLGGEEYEVNVDSIFNLDRDIYHSEFPKEWKDNVTKAPSRIIKPSKGYESTNNQSNRLSHWPHNSLSLNFDNEKEYDFNDDFSDDDDIDLTASEYEIYSKYLKDYYDDDNHTDDEEGFITTENETVLRRKNNIKERVSYHGPTRI